jgi:hypothetical protein
VDWVLLVATVVLVAVTAIYAAFNGWMALEMRAARHLSVRPGIIATMNMVQPGWGWFRLVNNGPGVALDVDVTITFSWPGINRPDERSWRSPSFRVGEVHDFRLPELEPKDNMNGLMDELVRRGFIARVAGTAVDVYGDAHTFADEIDFAAWWPTVVNSREDWHLPADERAAEALVTIAKGYDRSR